MNALNDTVASNNLYASSWLINICRHSRITMVLYWMVGYFFFFFYEREREYGCFSRALIRRDTFAAMLMRLIIKSLKALLDAWDHARWLRATFDCDV